MADPTTSTTVVPGAAVGDAAAGANPISAIADAAGKLFDLIGKAIEPGIISARSVADRLQRALPQYRNPFQDLQDDPRLKQNNTIILVIGAIIALLVVAIIFQPQKTSTQKFSTHG